MSATAKILLLPVRPANEQGPEGAADLTPKLGVTSATSGNTIQIYLGQYPTTSVAAVKLQVDAVDGSVQQTLSTSINSDGTSATYTSGSGDAWIAAAKSFNAFAVVTLIGDVSAPGATAVQWLSRPVLINVV